MIGVGRVLEKKYVPLASENRRLERAYRHIGHDDKRIVKGKREEMYVRLSLSR